MPDWKEMYLTLFREMSIAIEVLQKAQQATEEAYINTTERPLVLFPKNEENPPE